MKKTKLKIGNLERKAKAVVSMSDEKLRLIVGGQMPTGGTCSDTADCDQ
jgi:hypothetical protein